MSLIVKLQLILLLNVISGWAGVFEIDYENDTFKMDGKPFRYVSGSIHYFRLPQEMWRDRLQKMRAAGLNAISTYVEWSQHEKSPGNFDFSGDLDLVKFLQTAQEENLYVILRPGPYICAERDMGGLPYWLLKFYPDIRLRTNDARYTGYVKKWFDVLLPLISPLLYGNGGPIITVQVENEYGSYSPIDEDYKAWLRDLMNSYIGDKAVLFTTDGASAGNVRGGKIQGVYATVDFGPGTNVNAAFAAQRQFESKGPLINSEFYPGWLTHWGEPLAKRDTQAVVQTLREVLAMGANVNVYMFYGGTNFGFTAGANMGGSYQSDITSYDYDAPITEAGDLTEKYYAMAQVIKEYLGDPNVTVNFPDVAPKGDYGTLTLTSVTSLLSPFARSKLGRMANSTYPQTFEALDQNFGYLLYETQLPSSGSGELNVDGIRDMGQAYVNNAATPGVLSRESKQTKLNITGNQGDYLSIVVENLGRINFGVYNNDSKGIVSNVTLNNDVLTDWYMTSFDLNDITGIDECSSQCFGNDGYRFYTTKFVLNNAVYNGDLLADSFLNTTQLTKGLVFLNGKNLGRYWQTRGPQYSLYIPGTYFKAPPAENVMVILDENLKTDTISVSFETKPLQAKRIRYF